MHETGSLASKETKAHLERRIAELNFDTICVMLYTSGTTGRPKGVVLSNQNIIISSLNSCKFDNLTDKEEILSYLPIAWVGDFIFSFGQAAVVGLRVNCPESRETVSADLKEIGPSIILPRRGFLKPC